MKIEAYFYLYGPIKVAILAAFLFYRYKFLSQAKDKNLYRIESLYGQQR